MDKKTNYSLQVRGIRIPHHNAPSQGSLTRLVAQYIFIIHNIDYMISRFSLSYSYDNMIVIF